MQSRRASIKGVAVKLPPENCALSIGKDARLRDTVRATVTVPAALESSVDKSQKYDSIELVADMGVTNADCKVLKPHGISTVSAAPENCALPNSIITPRPWPVSWFAVSTM